MDDIKKLAGVLQLGYPPRRIDILTQIEAISFAQAWSNRVVGPLGGATVNYISSEDFITNKRAVGRPKDLADVAELEP